MQSFKTSCFNNECGNTLDGVTRVYYVCKLMHSKMWCSGSLNNFANVVSAFHELLASVYLLRIFIYKNLGVIYWLMKHYVFTKLDRSVDDGFVMHGLSIV